MSNQKKWKVRYTILLLMWSGWLLSFLDRMVMSISLPFIGKDLYLDKTEQGFIISAFFIGYAAFQIPGGFFADKFGARKVMAIAITWWSIFTSMTGLMFVLPLMLIVRFLFGVGEGCFPTGSWKMISLYFPSKERGRATAIQSSVNTLGPALATVVAASIIASFGWQMVFLVLGIPGLVIAALIYYYCVDKPEDNPRMSPEELQELAEDRQNSNTNIDEVVPLSVVLKQSMLWKMAITWFLFDITFWGFSTWLPSYLMEVRSFSLNKTGIITAIPFLCGTVGTILGGYFSDKFSDNRKIGYIGAAIISAGFLYMTFSVESADFAVIYQCISSFFMFFAMALFWGLFMDSIPTNIMGRASGVVNFGGQVAGVISPVIMGFLIEMSGNNNYDNAFLFMVIALLASAVIVLTIANRSLNIKS